MEILRFQFLSFQLKNFTPFFEKAFYFSENLFQSQSIENVQNFH